MQTAKSLPEPRNPAVPGTRMLLWRREAAAVSLHGNGRGKFLENRDGGGLSRGRWVPTRPTSLHPYTTTGIMYVAIKHRGGQKDQN